MVLKCRVLLGNAKISDKLFTAIIFTDSSLKLESIKKGCKHKNK